MFIMANFWPLITVSLTGVAGLVLLTSHPKWRDFLAFGVIVAGILTAFVLLHPRQTPLLGDAKAVQDMIGQGQPVLLEFQSPY
jgi:hypothetical protein